MADFYVKFKGDDSPLTKEPATTVYEAARFFANRHRYPHNKVVQVFRPGDFDRPVLETKLKEFRRMRTIR